MQSLADRQTDFADAIRDPGSATPAGLVGPDGDPSPRRFAVYRNNVVVGLINALGLAYPAVERIVGEAFFRAMARDFVLREPPQSPVLIGYGGGFPAFIQGFEPTSSLPYLADVARLERAWGEAYHAAEAIPLDAVSLGEIAPDALAGATVEFHPALRLVRSPYPVLKIWLMNRDQIPLEPVDMTAGGDDVLVSRPESDVLLRKVPIGGAVFVAALAEGCTLVEAADRAAAEPQFDLSENLTGLMMAGAIIRIGQSSPQTD